MSGEAEKLYAAADAAAAKGLPLLDRAECLILSYEGMERLLGASLETDGPDFMRDTVLVAQGYVDLRNEVLSVLSLMDGLAEQWGDEGVFRRCRDRLRAATRADLQPGDAK
jgi:hypothetical protein